VRLARRGKVRQGVARLGRARLGMAGNFERSVLNGLQMEISYGCFCGGSG
jgi:hypothetical protein